MYKFLKQMILISSLLTLPLLATDDLSITESNATDNNLTESNITVVEGNLMLWEVEGLHNGKVYLFGSIHVGKSDLYPLDKNITKAFNESDYLVVETKSDEASQLEANTAMFKEGRNSGVKTLKDLISDKNYERLQIKLKSLKMLPGSLDAFRPWAASMVISMTELIKFGYSPQFGLDRYFENRAEQTQKRIFSMESVNQQLGIFMDANDSFGEKLLELTLDTAPLKRADIEALFSKWKEGDTGFFEKELIKPLDKFPELKEKLLTQRNQKMTEKVNVYRGNRKGKNYFVVVGLAHLLGESGIVQQLKDQNVTVRRMAYELQHNTLEKPLFEVEE